VFECENEIKKEKINFILLVSEQYSASLVSTIHSSNKNHHFERLLGRTLLWFLVIWLTKISKKNYFGESTKNALDR
jgi:hypothetical protein